MWLFSEDRVSRVNRRKPTPAKPPADASRAVLCFLLKSTSIPPFYSISIDVGISLYFGQNCPYFILNAGPYILGTLGLICLPSASAGPVVRLPGCTLLHKSIAIYAVWLSNLQLSVQTFQMNGRYCRSVYAAFLELLRRR